MLAEGLGLARYRPLDHPEPRLVPIPGVGEARIPTDPAERAAWRKGLILEKNPARQADLAITCAKSCIFWFNAFVWTYKQRKVVEGGHTLAVSGEGVNVPFYTWPVQDQFINTLNGAIENGHDLAVDKSRQMGATWIIAGVFLWRFLYRKNENFMVMSATEDLVDNPGDPLAVFWKMDFILEHLPKWLKPTIERRRLRFINRDLKSTIMGKSTTGRQGRAGALTAALFDEAALMEVFEPAWQGAGQSTSCRIANSTPYGVGYFAKLVRKPGVPKFVLPWWDHPEKGRGRRRATDPDTGEVYITSPFFERECERAGGRLTREIARELSMDHAAAGATVFSSVVLNRQRAIYARPPFIKGDIRFQGAGPRVVALRQAERRHGEFVWVESTAGRWSLWTDLEADERGVDRPPQNRTYCFGIDIAQGVGASNSVISVYCLEIEAKVAEYVSSQTSPENLAAVACMAGWWFGGHQGPAFMVWEANGYGGMFGRVVVRVRYPRFYKHTQEDATTRKPTKRYGWHSNRQNKLDLMADLDAAMARDDFKNPSEAALDEAASYVHYEGGGIGPEELEVESDAARATHGDRAIADALAFYSSLHCKRASHELRKAPKWSPAWRRQLRERGRAGNVGG